MFKTISIFGQSEQREKTQRVQMAGKNPKFNVKSEWEHEDLIIIRSTICKETVFKRAGLTAYLKGQQYMFESVMHNFVPHFRVYYNYKPDKEDNKFDFVSYLVFHRYFKINESR